jgi:hypothetical protein
VKPLWSAAFIPKSGADLVDKMRRRCIDLAGIGRVTNLQQSAQDFD